MTNATYRRLWSLLGAVLVVALVFAWVYEASTHQEPVRHRDPTAETLPPVE